MPLGEPPDQAPSKTPNSDGLALRWFRFIGDVLARIPRGLAAVLAAAWAGMLWYLSSGPAPEVPITSFWSFIMNLGHAPLYGVFALLLALTLRRRARGWPDLAQSMRLVVLGLVLVYAVVDELHQSQTPQRTATWTDIVTDLVGAGATLTVAAYLLRETASVGGLTARLAAGLLACGAAAWIAAFG